MAAICNKLSEFHAQAYVELSSCKVIRNCILYIVDVCDPVIAAHIRDVEQVEYIESDNDALEVAPEIVGTDTVGRGAYELIAQSDIHTFVCRGANTCCVACCVFISENDTHESVPATNCPKSLRSSPIM